MIYTLWLINIKSKKDDYIIIKFIIFNIQILMSHNAIKKKVQWIDLESDEDEITQI